MASELESWQSSRCWCPASLTAEGRWRASLCAWLAPVQLYWYGAALLVSWLPCASSSTPWQSRLSPPGMLCSDALRLRWCDPLVLHKFCYTAHDDISCERDPTRQACPAFRTTPVVFVSKLPKPMNTVGHLTSIKWSSIWAITHTRPPSGINLLTVSFTHTQYYKFHTSHRNYRQPKCHCNL